MWLFFKISSQQVLMDRPNKKAHLCQIENFMLRLAEKSIDSFVYYLNGSQMYMWSHINVYINEGSHYACKHLIQMTFITILIAHLGLNKMYVWFLLPTYPKFF